MIFTLLLSAAFASAPAGVRPRHLQEEAVVWAVDGDGRVVALADRAAGLWVGEGRLQRLGSLSFIPDQIVAGEHVLVARSDRKGLTAETAWAVMDRSGAGVLKGSHDTPLIAARDTEDGAVLLFHDVLLVARLAEQSVIEIPLPFLGAGGLSLDGNVAVVGGPDGTSLRVGLSDGCALNLGDGPPDDALLASLWRRTALICGAPARLSPERTALADAALAARLEQALDAGDADLIFALGAGDVLESMRPFGDAYPGAVRTREEASVQVDASLVSSSGLTVVVAAPTQGMDLAPWVLGAAAPACVAPVVLAPREAAVATYLSLRVAALRDAGTPCADGLRVAVPGQVGAWKDSLFYVQADGTVKGARSGGVSARRVRLDLAWLTGEADPLFEIAAAPELVPEWHLGPGPAFGPVLDVNGSWIAGAGWDLLRGNARAKRVERVSLPGAVTSIRVRRDGRLEVLAGGHPARVIQETGEIEWSSAPADSAAVVTVERVQMRARPAVDPGPWRAMGSGRLQAAANAGGGTKHLPVSIKYVENRDGGTVVYTELGLLGLDEDGEITWRLTDLVDWVLCDDLIVGATPFGLAGWRLPW
jgi:hypothetical protein